MSKDKERLVAVLTANKQDMKLVNSCLREVDGETRFLWVSTAEQFVEVLDKETLEIIILNIDEYESTIRQVVKLKDIYLPGIPVIAISKKADEKSIAEALNDGANDLVSVKRKVRLRIILNREFRASQVEKALNSTLISATEYRKQLLEHQDDTGKAVAYVLNGIVTDANKTWIQLFGEKSKPNMAGIPLTTYFLKESHAAINGAIAATAAGKWQADEMVTVKSAEDNPAQAILDLSFQPAVYDGSTNVRISISTNTATTQEKKRILYDVLTRDPTTGFSRREVFLKALAKRLSDKPKSGVLTLVYIKPDDFSEVHERVGIIETEEVLAQFSKQINMHMHPGDIAGRFEGTAIMVLLARGNERDAAVWGKQLVARIRKHKFAINNQTLNMTCSIGMASAAEVNSNLEELVSGSFDAYKQAKSAGGNSVIIGELTDANSRLKRYDELWVGKIQTSLAQKRFRLAQLPIAGLRSQSTQMYDMLIRMVDQQGNSIIPSEFLPAAERNNLMPAIDRWMIKSSMEFCTVNAANKVFIRLSLQSMQDLSLMHWVRNKLETINVDPSCIVLQIPEQSAAKYIRETATMVKELHQMGVNFALEHYCVKANRLHILDILRPNYIKIDGTLMHSLVSDAALQESVNLLTCAASERSIETIAERVENANTMAVLFQLGIHFMQGHYIHEPAIVLQEPSNLNNVFETKYVNSGTKT